jgi:hypothetical protein
MRLHLRTAVCTGLRVVLSLLTCFYGVSVFMSSLVWSFKVFVPCESFFRFNIQYGFIALWKYQKLELKTIGLGRGFVIKCAWHFIVNL